MAVDCAATVARPAGVRPWAIDEWLRDRDMLLRPFVLAMTGGGGFDPWKDRPWKSRRFAKPANAKLAARRKREAEALRANLRKRKDQARAREKPKQE